MSYIKRWSSLRYEADNKSSNQIAVLTRIHYKRVPCGFDINPTMNRIGLRNLMMHGITQSQIDYKDKLSKNYHQDNFYDIVLANPPFTGNID